MVEHINDFLSEIKPAFDSILFLATYQDKGQTKVYISTQGNQFANESVAAAYLDGELDEIISENDAL